MRGWPSRVLCEVWLADTGLEQPHHQLLLDSDEAARRAAYRKNADKTRFTVGAALLRLVAARELGGEAATMPVDRSCRWCGRPHGKPRITQAGLHLSVSHSGSKVAVAVTRSAPIGIDVEILAVRDVDGLADHVLAPGEQLRSADDFFVYWCRKESVVKATGDGLSVPLNQVVVSAAQQPARLISYRGMPLAARMQDVPIDSGYAAALTVLADDELEIQVIDAATLLSSYEA